MKSAKIHKTRVQYTPIELPPSDPCSERLFEYFPHHWDFIQKAPDSKDWITVKSYKPSPRVIWSRYQDPKKIIGVRFGQHTRYGMTDLDRGSVLHFQNNPDAFQDLCHAFEAIGLCSFVLLYSSYSMGLHLYFPLPEQVETFDFACALRMAVEGAGFAVKNGQLELFPNTKQYKKNTKNNDFSCYNGHRLPLQPASGSILLDDDFSPCSENLKDFFTQMDLAAEQQDMETLRSVLSVSKDWYKRRKYNVNRFSHTNTNNNINRVKEWQEDTETIIQQGFTDAGQTNDLLREIGKYGRVFKALAGNDLHSYMRDTITSLPGYEDCCAHQHEIDKRCYHWAKIIEPFWWPLGTAPTRHQTFEQINQEGQKISRNLNVERMHECKNRLQQTLTHLLNQAIALPQKVGARLVLLCETSKRLFGKAFSKRTLQKEEYLMLWHPKFDGNHNATSAEIVSTKKHHISPPNSSHAEDDVPQDTIQPISSIPNTSTSQITPSTVVSKSLLLSESLKGLSSKPQQELDHTLPYMKSFVAAQPPANFSQEELILENDELEESNSNNEFFLNYLTSSQKLDLTSLMVGKSYRFLSDFASGLVELKDQKQDQVRSILKNTVVIVLDEFHSSSLSDDSRPVMLYVQPAEEVNDWLSGIAVPVSHLQPL